MQSWTNQTVTPASQTTQPDDMPAVRQPILFYEEETNIIKRYGGWPYEGTSMPSEAWYFDIGGTSVNWRNGTSPADNGLSANSHGPFASASAYTNSTFYNFGGNVFKPNALPNMTVLSGLVTQDYASRIWSNNTADIPNQSKYRTQARAVHVPNFGGEGFIMVVGGESPPTEASFYETGTAMTDMSVITLYDIESGNWYTQKATGEIPPPRSEFCAVGSATGDGQYFDLFVYGGSTNTTFDLNNADDEGYLNVYALSLPAFQWFKSPSTTTVRRACHTCSVIGNRQMVSIGGRLPSSLQDLGVEQDPWPNGIGVFDMTEFAWVDHYDAAAEVYDSPDLVKQYYASSYQEPAWSDPTLASIFAYTVTSSTNSTSSGGSSSSDSSGSDSDSSDNTGAIVGGVVGGVALIVILLGVWYWLRRRRRPAHTIPDEKDQKFQPVPHEDLVEAGSRPPCFEADSNLRSELDGLGTKPQTIAELPANDERENHPRQL
ncbi:uncharacterized protein Z518_00400 [Rhinocladiella mackenziei CBS 650.93]|uniref:Kelch repeat protein n=1 Tax=Rhinocladiella mackenziei CBS 650.93 TaxID=1442369 RepID=A0A0D2J0U9_9EURO|nr:uncharacterized protein Z518_00400 [Rhinocladiella mackenziei CBS 650.93]KIX09321.1 hypothetical protein Z518_00400 [Rhinocladiella mackenziei CBS 650.93]